MDREILCECSRNEESEVVLSIIWCILASLFLSLISFPITFTRMWVIVAYRISTASISKVPIRWYKLGIQQNRIGYSLLLRPNSKMPTASRATNLKENPRWLALGLRMKLDMQMMRPLAKQREVKIVFRMVIMMGMASMQMPMQSQNVIYAVLSRRLDFSIRRRPLTLQLS